jgi:long-chain acyl-CoA synthetase
MKLLHRLNQHAADAPQRVAYREVTGDVRRELTYGELARAVSGFAGRVRSGAVVMLCLPNRIEYLAAFLGILAGGASVFPVSPELTEAELQTLARESGAAAVVGTERACAALRGHVPTVIPAVDVLRQAGATAPIAAGGDLLLCSSGTTSLPKIVVRTAGSVDAVSENMVRAIGFGAADRVLAIVPLCHSYGLEHGLLAPVWAGSTVHLCAGLDLDVVLNQLATAGITLFPSVPSVYEMMCQAGDAQPFPALRHAYAAGAPLPASVADAFHAKFGVRIGQLYGATEIGSVTFSDPHRPHFDPRSVGVPYAGVTVRIVDSATREPAPPGDEGEVLISATSMFRGYLHQTTLATVEGFVATGDLGRVDEYGNLTITGRLKLLIEIGGNKVNVLEVEELLRTHPRVGEAAVVAMRVSDTVSRLKAVVTPRDPTAPPDPDDVRRHLRERLTAYKVPRVIEIRPDLPRSPAGKVLRRALEEA